MAETKITDLVDQSVFDELARLRIEMGNVVKEYTAVAKELAKGLSIDVKVVGDLDKLQDFYNTAMKKYNEVIHKASEIQSKYNDVLEQTTTSISRELAEVDKQNRANQEQYNSIDKAKKILDQYKDSMNNHAQRIVAVTARLSDLKKSIDENNKAYKDGKISLSELAEANGKLTVQYEALKQDKAKMLQLMNAEIKLNQSGVESYTQLSQQLELMKKAYKDLDRETREGVGGEELLSQINELDAHLKDLAGNMGEFQRNVGNYAIAGRNGVVSTESLTSALEKQAVTTKDLQDQNKILAEAKDLLKREDENYPVLLAQINTKIEENNKALGINTQEQESAKKSLKELVLEISNLTLQYQALSDEEKDTAEGKALASHIQDLIERAGQLKDAIGDTNRAISNAASDTRGFDQLTEGAELAASAFELVEGAAAALGIQEGELQEVQTRLLSAMALANSASKIQNALQKESAVMQGVLSVQTRLRTIAENLHTAAQGKGVVMTKLLTAAQWGFNAAANANPIGLLVAGITALVAAGYGLTKLFKTLTGDSETVKKAYEEQVKAIDTLTEAHDRLIEKMKARGATEAETLSQTIKNHREEAVALEELMKKAAKLYGKDSDQYKEAAEKKKEIDEDFKASKEDAHDYIDKLIHETNVKDREKAVGTYQVKREIIADELRMQRELLSSMLEVGEITYEQYNDMLKTLELRKQLKLEEVDKSEKKDKENKAKNAEKAYKELQQATKAGEDALLNLIEDSIERERQAEQYRYDRQLKELQRQLKKQGAKSKEMRTAILNQIEGLEAEHAKKLQDLDDTALERRLNANEAFLNSRVEAAKTGSKEEMDATLEILKVQQSREMLEIKKQEDNHTITKEQTEEIRANIVEKYAKKELETRQEYAQKWADKLLNDYADEETKRDISLQSGLIALQRDYNERIKAAGSNTKEHEKIEQEYQDQIYQLQMKYAQDSVKASIEVLEKVLQNEDLSVEKRKELETELAQLKVDLDKMVVDSDTHMTQTTIANAQKRKKEQIEAAMSWVHYASQAISSVSDMINGLFDSQAEKLDAQMEANQAAGDTEVERINEMVEKQVITQEEGEARKRAAEAKTAKENEKLEKKKAELQYKQAVWEKANSLAQAAIATALSLMQLWVKPGWPAAIPMMAVVGALGAVQMATIAATPIPKYAEGTAYHFGGPAVVGDGGKHELVMIGSNAFITPDTPTVVDLPKGASVFPDITESLLRGIVINTSPILNPEPIVPIVNINTDNSEIKRGLKELAELTKSEIKLQLQKEYNLDYELFKKTKI